MPPGGAVTSTSKRQLSKRAGQHQKQVLVPEDVFHLAEKAW